MRNYYSNNSLQKGNDAIHKSKDSNQQTEGPHRYKILLTTGRAVEYGQDRWEALLPRRPRRVEVSSSSSSSPRSTSPRCTKTPG